MLGQQYRNAIGPAAMAGKGLAPQQETAPPTLREQLEHHVAFAENQLADAKRALEIFNRNPDELEELVTIVQRRGF